MLRRVGRRLGRDWYHWTYVLDYVTLAVVSIALFFFNKYATPYKRVIVPNDPSIMYPLEDDIVPTWATIFLSVSFPLVTSACFQLYYRSFHDFHHTAVGNLFSIIISAWLTEIFKVTGGRPRPNWSATKDNEREPLLSFPSGHTSNSFSGLMFGALYLMGKMRIFHNSGPFSGHPAGLLLASSPLLVAGLVGISRTRDYHHHFDDVVAGAVLGSAVGAAFYFLYFHGLSSPHSTKPKSRRTDKFRSSDYPFSDPMDDAVFKGLDDFREATDDAY